MTSNNENVNNNFRQDSKNVVVDEKKTFKGELDAMVEDPSRRMAILFVEGLFERKFEEFDELVQKNAKDIYWFDRYLNAVKADFFALGIHYRSVFLYSVYVRKLTWFIRRRLVQETRMLETCYKEVELAFSSVIYKDGMETMTEIIDEYVNLYKIEENEQLEMRRNHTRLKACETKLDVVDHTRKTENEVVKQQSCNAYNSELINQKKTMDEPVPQTSISSEKDQMPCSESGAKEIFSCCFQTRDSCFPSVKDCNLISGISTDINAIAGCPYPECQSMAASNSVNDSRTSC